MSTSWAHKLVTMICWDEPGDGEECVTHRITPEEAIKRVAHVKAKHPEATDAQLLDYFVVNHWAWEEQNFALDQEARKEEE